MAGPPANRVRQSYGSAPATPRERVYVSRAADDPPESAPPAGCTRKSRPDPGIDRASSPSRRITAGKVNHRPFALASFFSKLLGRVRSQARKGCHRIIRVKRGRVVLGVPFGTGPAHVMEFGPVRIEQEIGEILQGFAQIGHHRAVSASSYCLSHGPLPPSFPRPLSGQLVKKR